MIDIFISPDCMEVFIRLDITDPDRKSIGFSEIVDTVKKKLPIVHSMIDLAAIEQFVSNKIYNTRVRVAQGIPPQKGTDGTLSWHFDMRKSSERMDVSLKDESDLKAYVLYDTVERNQLLVSVVSPVPGQPGKDLFGRKVEAPQTVKATLPEGKFVIVSPDKMKMYAARSGRAAFLDGVVEVFDCFFINGHCDAKTGDIDFSGDVVVDGNVYTGMNIKAAGNIEILGIVEGASLHAQGDVILRKEVSAAGKGMIVSEKSVLALSIENATVEAKQIIMAGSILHSNVFCIGSVEASSIVGGNTYAGRLIKAKTIGSSLGAPSHFEVGILPKYRERKVEIEKESAQCDEGIVQLLQLAKGLPNNATEVVKELKKRIARELLSLQQQKTALENETQEIEALFLSIDEGQVLVSEHAYAGCKITIGSADYVVESDEDAASFKKEESSVVHF